ncbi:MAG: energy-coupling factor transporter transmembrane protein EcfT [Lachnospiraceae bacterium]|nr:energy-coupling factor transporter transmembrane protein EcfT [Lachnospiraceae bacterium]
MLREITIGQYYPSASLIHRLDPRVKLVGTMVYLVSLFLFDTFYGFIAAIAFIGGIVFLSKVPVRYILRGLKPILFLLCFTVLFNFFLTPGDILVKFWIFKITKEGLYRGAFVGLRLILLIFGSSILTFTTTPMQLTDGLESLMKPLKWVKVPVHDIAMMMSIALRFIPILLEETDKIMKAQQARGADFESGGIFTRAKAMIPIFVPLLISAFRRAFDLAMAMEARCYNGGAGRTKLHPLQFHMRDYLAFAYLFVYLALIIVLRRWI